MRVRLQTHGIMNSRREALRLAEADSGQGLRANRTGQHRNGCEAAFPVDWPRQALSRHPLAAVRQMPDPSPLWNAGAANKQTGAVRQINRPEGGSQMNSDSDLKRFARSSWECWTSWSGISPTGSTTGYNGGKGDCPRRQTGGKGMDQ